MMNNLGGDEIQQMYHMKNEILERKKGDKNTENMK